MSNNQTDYYNFLALDLASINEAGFVDPSQIAYEVCLLFSINKDVMPESFFRLYTTPVDIDYNILINSVSYFSGAGFLNIECDCSEASRHVCDINNIHQNEFFLMGSAEKQTNSIQWISMRDGIDRYRLTVLDKNYDC